MVVGTGVLVVDAGHELATVEVGGPGPAVNSKDRIFTLLQCLRPIGLLDKGIGVYPIGFLWIKAIALLAAPDIAGFDPGLQVWLQRAA